MKPRAFDGGLYSCGFSCYKKIVLENYWFNNFVLFINSFVLSILIFLISIFATNPSSRNEGHVAKNFLELLSVVWAKAGRDGVLCSVAVYLIPVASDHRWAAREISRVPVRTLRRNILS